MPLCSVQVTAKEDQAASALDISRRGDWLVAGFSDGVMRVSKRTSGLVQFRCFEYTLVHTRILSQ